MRRGFLLLLLCGAVLGVGGAALLARERMARCAYVPLLAGELLPNANLRPGAVPGMPDGWSRAWGGVELRGPAVGNGEGFDLDGDGRALQLIGIANEVETAPVNVRPGDSYCFAGRAITDSEKGSETRLRVAFDWRDAQGHDLAEDVTAWQPVVLWRKDAPPAGWSPISAAFQAPANAVALVVRLQPASDDRIYLDTMHIRRTTGGGPRPELGRRQPTTGNGRNAQSSVVVEPWPNGYRAALSFSFDWETAMGGLIHSVSDDVNKGNPLMRAMRMREGVTTTLDLFRPYGIRATYYANGYNFLLGNTEQRQFMGNPIFAWADDQAPHTWPDKHWTTTRWFANDPYGTVRSNPEWYFGDLIPLLQAARQDIQSHTFSHFNGGFASPAEWRADLEAWREVAAERGVARARSAAFPWSGSAGMSYASWDALEAAGITSVTRTNWTLPQYRFVSYEDPHCKPVPGHERILACPDFYLHSQETAAQALKLIDKTIAVSGTLDIWAHTEEITSPEQIAMWREVVSYAARQRDAGRLWIAPLAEIADWRQALNEVRIENHPAGRRPRTTQRGDDQEPKNSLSFAVVNDSRHDLQGLTVALPFTAQRVTVNGSDAGSQFSMLGSDLVLDIRAGKTMEVLVWPA